MKNHSKIASAINPSRTRERKRQSDVKRSVANPDKIVADCLRASLAKKEEIKRTTIGLYSLKTTDSAFGFPFCAVNDKLALMAAKQLLPLANLYKVGSFCLYNGKTTVINPVLILDNKVE